MRSKCEANANFPFLRSFSLFFVYQYYTDAVFYLSYCYLYILCTYFVIFKYTIVHKKSTNFRLSDYLLVL